MAMEPGLALLVRDEPAGVTEWKAACHFVVVAAFGRLEREEVRLELLVGSRGSGGLPGPARNESCLLAMVLCWDWSPQRDALYHDLEC